MRVLEEMECPLGTLPALPTHTRLRARPALALAQSLPERGSVSPLDDGVSK